MTTTWTGTMANILVTELIEFGFDNEENEQLPWDLAQTLCRLPVGEKADGIGLLTLCVAIANWGVKFPENIGVKDPAGFDWKGRPAKLGKHMRDYKYGGVGLAHFDSTALRRFWDKFYDSPLAPPRQLKRPEDWDFNVFIRSADKKYWLEWFRKLVNHKTVQNYMLNYWLEHFWNPVWSKQFAARETENITVDDVGRAAVNARIRNSVPAVARRVVGQPVNDQIAEYLKHGRKKRGKRGEDRYRRQADFALRVPLIFNYARIQPIDEPLVT